MKTFFTDSSRRNAKMVGKLIYSPTFFSWRPVWFPNWSTLSSIGRKGSKLSSVTVQRLLKQNQEVWKSPKHNICCRLHLLTVNWLLNTKMLSISWKIKFMKNTNGDWRLTQRGKFDSMGRYFFVRRPMFVRILGPKREAKRKTLRYLTMCFFSMFYIIKLTSWLSADRDHSASTRKKKSQGKLDMSYFHNEWSKRWEHSASDSLELLGWWLKMVSSANEKQRASDTSRGL